MRRSATSFEDLVRGIPSVGSISSIAWLHEDPDPEVMLSQLATRELQRWLPAVDEKDEDETRNTSSRVRKHSHKHEDQCSICCFPVDGQNGAADLRLGCGCGMHYFCIVGHIKNELKNKAAVLAKAKDADENLKGIMCPNATLGGKCLRAPHAAHHDGGGGGGGGGGGEGGGGGGGGGEASVSFFITLADMDELLFFRNRIVRSPRGQIALRAAKEDEQQASVEHLFLSQADVDKLRFWLTGEEPRALPPPPPDDPYLLATTRPCPAGCGTRGTHYAGHHCHHYNLSAGCGTCSEEYCWSCNSTASDNVKLRHDKTHCACPGKSWNRGCAPLRTTADIATFLVLSPYPHDSRCGCPICPDCKEGVPCPTCGDPDGNDWNCAVCAGFILPGPRELDPTWAPQTEEMKAKSAIEPAPISRDQRDFFDAAANGNINVVRHLLGARLADINAQDGDRRGATACYSAAAEGHLNVFRFLLEQGADANIANQDGRTPSFMAAHEGHLDMLRLLLAHGADVSKPDQTGETPLEVAIRYHREPCIELLR